MEDLINDWEFLFNLLTESLIGKIRRGLLAIVRVVAIFVDDVDSLRLNSNCLVAFLISCPVTKTGDERLLDKQRLQLSQTGYFKLLWLFCDDFPRKSINQFIFTHENGPFRQPRLSLPQISQVLPR